MRMTGSIILTLCLLMPGMTHAGEHLRIETSPCRFVLGSPKEQQVELRILAVSRLWNVSVNRVRVARAMPTESALSLQPDGKAIFTYSDLYLHNFRGREQALNANDDSGEPREHFLHPPKDAKPPKFLLDLWKVNATHLFMNSREDILWWTGELIYRFDFAFPVVSFKLESPDGRQTMVGDWNWKKPGRAVKIYVSTDGQKWAPV